MLCVAGPRQGSCEALPGEDGCVPAGRRPPFRLLAKYIHKTVRTDTDRARCDWLLLMIKYCWVKK